MEAISVIKMMPETAQQINQFANECTLSIQDGNECPLDMFIKIKAAIDSLSLIKESIKEDAYAEAQKYGTKFQKNGATINLRQSTKYNFDNVNDPDYFAILEQYNKLNKEKKAKEKELKAISDSSDRVNQETGEVYTVHPPAKMSTDTVAISFSEPTIEVDHTKNDMPF